MKKIFAVVAAIALVSEFAQAQTARETNCTYQQCALGLAPVWNGLAVTRGESQEQVALLGFFWPDDVSRAFEGDRQAVQKARDAMATRQVGAVLTDAGIVLAFTGVARGLFHHDWDKFSTALALGGGTALVASVPFQFAADGYLSRAVWLFNRRFAR
jgi:hypothetical protein